MQPLMKYSPLISINLSVNNPKVSYNLELLQKNLDSQIDYYNNEKSKNSIE